MYFKYLRLVEGTTINQGAVRLD